MRFFDKHCFGNLHKILIVIISCQKMVNIVVKGRKDHTKILNTQLEMINITKKTIFANYKSFTNLNIYIYLLRTILYKLFNTNYLLRTIYYELFTTNYLVRTLYY